MEAVTVGPIHFFPEPRGAHVRVTVRGDGTTGSRPLLGYVTMSPDEWEAFAVSAESTTWPP
jgi:hypothetical protein